MDGVNQAVSLSFPIIRKEYTPDGDIVVWGKATDGSLDSDNQIVDPVWSGKALQDWLATGGNVRVQHSPHLYPAGKGVEVQLGEDGAHWVKALVVEPTAKTLVEKGVLSAYSVGIARPQIIRDMQAPGGKIIGGMIAELSLVDRPANKNCGFQLMKSEGSDGHAEFVGKLFGDTDTITKAGPKGYSHGWVFHGTPGKIPDKIPTKGLGDRSKTGQAVQYNKRLDDIARHDGELDVHDHFNVAEHHDAAARHAEKLGGFQDRVAHHKEMAEAHRKAGFARHKKDFPQFYDENGNSLAKGEESGPMPFTPKDLADFIGKRDFSQDERDSAASSGAAMPDGSFPIKNGGDLKNAIRLAGNAKDPAAAKRHIKRRAAALGMSDQIPDTWKGAEPELVKGEKDCPDCGKTYHADSNQRSCENCGSKLPSADKSADPDVEERADADIEKGELPAALREHQKKPKGDNEDEPDEDEGDSKPPWLKGKSAQPTDGVKAKDSKPLPRHREPDGPQMEELEEDAGLQEGRSGDESGGTGMPNGMWDNGRPKNTPDTMKSEAPYSVARLHDALCAAYHMDDVSAAYPSMKGVVGALTTAWHDLDETAHNIVKNLWPAGEEVAGLALDDARAAISKSFSDMYPNVHLTPGKITAGQFTRPYVSAGHAPLSAAPAGHMPGPGDAQFGSTTTMSGNASQFGRDYLSAGHASQSAASTGNNSIPGGRPAGQRLAAAAKEQAANAMTNLHDHLASNHPYLCAMSPGSSDQLNAVSKSQVAELEQRIELLQKQHATEIGELRALIDQLGSQPDPGAAAHRGIVTKSVSGGAGPADRRSLVDEAATKDMQERQAFFGMLAQHGDAGLREAARAHLSKISTPEN